MSRPLQARSRWWRARPAAAGAASRSRSARRARPSTRPGRSTRERRSEVDRPETIEETAELVDRGRRRRASPSRSTTSTRRRSRALVERIDAEQGRLDVLVNDIWGAEHLFEWNTPVWEHDLDQRPAAAAARDRHAPDHEPPRAAAAAAPARRAGRRGHRRHRRVQRRPLPRLAFYDLAKTSVIRIAWAHGAGAAATHGGDRGRAHAGLDALGGDARALRRDARRTGARRRAHRRTSASPRRRASSAAPSPRSPPTRTSARWNGQSLSSGQLAQVYGFTDLDGTQPGLLALHRRGGRGGPARRRHRLPLSEKSGECRNRRSCGVVQDEAAERERRIPSDRRRSMPQYALLIYHPEGRNPSREEMYDGAPALADLRAGARRRRPVQVEPGPEGRGGGDHRPRPRRRAPGHRRAVRRDEGVPGRLLPHRVPRTSTRRSSVGGADAERRVRRRRGPPGRWAIPTRRGGPRSSARSARSAPPCWPR